MSYLPGPTDRVSIALDSKPNGPRCELAIHAFAKAIPHPTIAKAHALVHCAVSDPDMSAVACINPVTGHLAYFSPTDLTWEGVARSNPQASDSYRDRTDALVQKGFNPEHSQTTLDQPLLLQRFIAPSDHDRRNIKHWLRMSALKAEFIAIDVVHS